MSNNSTTTNLPPEWQAMADATGKPFSEGGAYSSDCYADWVGCVWHLFQRGATLDGAETVLRSKHMRWCSDGSPEPYGQATVEHFANYLDKSGEVRAMAEIPGSDAPDLTHLMRAAQSAATRFACSLTAILDAIPDEPRFADARGTIAMQIGAASRVIDLGPMRERLTAEGLAK